MIDDKIFLWIGFVMFLLFLVGWLSPHVNSRGKTGKTLLAVSIICTCITMIALIIALFLLEVFK